jgi:succinoglycan biosynthesis transport protein ExoP
VSTTPEPFNVHPPDRELDFRYYTDLVWRSRTLLATVALVGLVLGLLVAYLQTPEYKAVATLQIDPPTPTFLSVTDALVGSGNYFQNTDFYNTQFQILRSRPIAQKVVDRLKLQDQAPFKAAPDPAALFVQHVTVEPVTDTRLVMIGIIHEDKKEAALWANALAAAYIEESLSTRVEAARRAYDWLQGRLAATQQSMREAQDKLFKSYQNQDLFVPEGSVSAVTASITRLNEDYISAQSKRIGLEAALSQVAEMRRRSESLDTVPQVASDQIVLTLNSQIGTLNVELSRLKEKFKEAHPEVQKVQAQLEQVKKAREARDNQIVQGLTSDYAQTQEREAELKVAIEKQKAQAATQSRKATELEALKKEGESAKGLYEVLLQKLNETDIAASIRTNNVSLVEPASVPSSPIRPQKMRIAGIALLLGLVVGVGLVLTRDYFDNTIKDPEEVERYLHLDLLAGVPKFDESNLNFATEAYQNIRTALIFGRKDETGQVVLITGTAPQEGKTTTLVNIAKLLAASGEKTVVVDFDMRRSSLHARLGLTREPGATDFFVQHQSLETLVRPTRTPGLFALTAGPLPPSPPALLARKSVGVLFDELRKSFEWVLVDSPPLASVTDGFLLARHADMVVMVVQYNKVDKKLVKRNVSMLQRANPNVLGAVLNGVDVKAQGYYYYHHDPAQAADGTSGPRSVKAAPG